MTYGIIEEYKLLEYEVPEIFPVCWLIITPSPILKLPVWSVDVYTTRPPFLASVSFSWIGTPPIKGIAWVMSVPEPIYSKEWPDAKTLLCL